MRQNLQSTQGNAKPRVSAKITSERSHSQGTANYKKGILNNFVKNVLKLEEYNLYSKSRHYEKRRIALKKN